MIIPIRCFNCGKVIGNKWEKYVSLIREGYTVKEALDILNLDRYCCRNVLMSHVNIIDQLLQY